MSIFLGEDYTPLERDILIAYKKKDVSQFNMAVSNYYEGMTAEGYIMGHEDHLIEKPPFISVTGDRNYAFHAISKITYYPFVRFFSDNLTCSDYEYNITWNAFCDYFSDDNMSSQFKFTKHNGQPASMYSWRNPGFSRLEELSRAAKVVETRFFSRHKK